jgi:hypothetical protein
MRRPREAKRDGTTRDCPGLPRDSTECGWLRETRHDFDHRSKSRLEHNVLLVCHALACTWSGEFETMLVMWQIPGTPIADRVRVRWHCPAASELCLTMARTAECATQGVWCEGLHVQQRVRYVCMVVMQFSRSCPLLPSLAMCVHVQTCCD